MFFNLRLRSSLFSKHLIKADKFTKLNHNEFYVKLKPQKWFKLRQNLKDGILLRNKAQKNTTILPHID